MYWLIGRGAPAWRPIRAKPSCGPDVSLGSFLKGPLQGKTSLSKVFWLYGLLGSVLVSALGLAVDTGNELAMRIYMVLSLLFTVYVSIATYQCAANCRSTLLAR